MSLLLVNLLILKKKITEELKESEDVIEEDKQNPKGNCKEYRLVKRYADLEDLTKDNNTPVFVDKKYDETPYDIGESWKRDNSMLIAEADDDDIVIQELTKFLIKNNGIEKEKAEIDATAMVLGARPVQDGEYAILAIGDGDIKYYIRQDNIWKYDKTLSGKTY